MKRNFTFLFGKRFLLFTCFSLFGSLIAIGQFTITENFKNSTANNAIVLGGTPHAYLTAGQVDPEGEGWLRLTESKGNQKGYAYIDKSFPSQLGVLVDFEFKAWRSSSDTKYAGADGFSVFLFDANIPQFVLGGYGGSLGYAPTNPTVSTGLAGGYIGIGLDEYGNYSNPTEGRNGGPGVRPNSIVLRGATTNDASTTNEYLAGHQLTSDVNSDEGIDYNEAVTTRPDDNTFYRRVQISIMPDNGQYHILVKMAKTPNGDFTEYINQTTATPPPANLKLGFAASTGGGFNYHEIRNIVVTTPGGARIDNSPSVPTTTIGSAVQFTVNAYNTTNAPLSNFLLTNTFYDGDGHIIPSDQIQIDNIEYLNNGNTQNVMTGQTIGDGTTSNTFNLDAASSSVGDAVGTFIIHATVLKKPAGGVITNVAHLDDSNTGISDADQTNNTSSSQIKVIESDLEMNVSHNGDYVAGEDNAFTIHVVNNGPDAASLPSVLNDTLPAGFTYVGTLGDQGNGWNISLNDNIISATYNGTVIVNGGSFPDLVLPVAIDKSLGGSTVSNKLGVDNNADYTTSNNYLLENMTIKPAISLPVGLTEFTGHRSGNANLLHWITATEVNNKGFNLQRSSDGGNSWMTISFIKSQGSSSNFQNYSYLDEDGALFGEATYRLQQVNLDGDVLLLNKIVSVQGAEVVKVHIAPNPAHGSFKISGLNSGDIISIYSASGQRVRQLKATGVVELLEISDLVKGIYFIKVGGAGKSTTIKLIAQ